uniref:Uncharacterized protein isoform X2 n=1 Tax=Nicotiana tabacum TaxID=4097 RepID=A0A1S4CBP7_TOBAC|nr:PREDICTED: uncharacterized protein LOC107817119 isoform X2 [Nicotiana tabacum]
MAPKCFILHWICDSNIHCSAFIGPIHQMDRQPVKQMAVESQNPDYSHFVSLPLAIYPELVNKLINFQSSVLGITEVSKSPTSESKASELLELGIEKSIFINPKTFHLTVLMLKLWNKDDFEAAAQVLRSVSPKVLDALESRPVSIRLKGLVSIYPSYTIMHFGLL